MERLRIRGQHVGTREESRTLSFSDRCIQQETFTTEMNSASSETMVHLPSDDQSSDTMIYLTGIVLPPPPLHTMQLTRTHLLRMHGMVPIRTIHRSGRYSKNVSVTEKEKRRGLMSSSRRTGIIEAKILVMYMLDVGEDVDY